MGEEALAFTTYFETVAWDTIGPVGLLAIAVILVLTGKLIPSRTAQREVDALERENIRLQEEVREWRHAYRTVEEAQRISARQLEEMLEYARATDAVLRALQELQDSDNS